MAKKSKFQKSESHLLELFKYYLWCSFLAICFIKSIFDEFSNIYPFRTKIVGGDATKSAISQCFCPNRILLTPDDVELMSGRVMPSFMSISARVQELFRKNRGGAILPPPPRWLRVNSALLGVSTLSSDLPLAGGVRSPPV